MKIEDQVIGIWFQSVTFTCDTGRKSHKGSLVFEYWVRPLKFSNLNNGLNSLSSQVYLLV